MTGLGGGIAAAHTMGAPAPHGPAKNVAASGPVVLPEPGHGPDAPGRADVPEPGDIPDGSAH